MRPFPVFCARAVRHCTNGPGTAPWIGPAAGDGLMACFAAENRRYLGACTNTPPRAGHTIRKPLGNAWQGRAAAKGKQGNKRHQPQGRR